MIEEIIEQHLGYVRGKNIYDIALQIRDLLRDFGIDGKVTIRAGKEEIEIKTKCGKYSIELDKYYYCCGLRRIK